MAKEFQRHTSPESVRIAYIKLIFVIFLLSCAGITSATVLGQVFSVKIEGRKQVYGFDSPQGQITHMDTNRAIAVTGLNPIDDSELFQYYVLESGSIDVAGMVTVFEGVEQGDHTKTPYIYEFNIYSREARKITEYPFRLEALSATGRYVIGRADLQQIGSEESPELFDPTNIVILDVSSGEVQYSEKKEQSFYVLTWSHDDRYVVIQSCTQDSTCSIELIDIRTRQATPIVEFRVPERSIRVHRSEGEKSHQFSPTGDRFVYQTDAGVFVYTIGDMTTQYIGQAQLPPFFNDAGNIEILSFDDLTPIQSLP